jgi:hypothetical protein
MGRYRLPPQSIDLLFSGHSQRLRKLENMPRINNAAIDQGDMTVNDGRILITDAGTLPIVMLGRNTSGQVGLEVNDANLETVVAVGTQADGQVGMEVFDQAGGPVLLGVGKNVSGRYGMEAYDSAGHALLGVGRNPSGKYGLEVYDTGGIVQLRVGELASSVGYGMEAVDSNGKLVTLLNLAFGMDADSLNAFESTSSTTFTNLATTGPTVTVDINTSGRALVIISANCLGPSGVTAGIGYAVSGATTVAATTARVLEGGFSTAWAMQSTAVFLQTGLNAGSNTFQCKYIANGGSASFGPYRGLTVMPF